MEDLGEIPENYIVKPFIPQLDVLKRADLFITHAGNNSINESLSFGCPMVLCPQQGEQRTAARQLDLKGVGITTGSRCPSSKKIYDAVNEILENDKYKKKAIKASVGLKEARESSNLLDVVQEYSLS